MHLDLAISTQIITLRDQLLASGELLPLDRLKDFYRLFRQRFGPDRLSSLDGEELLETMHNSSNRDSMTYWLEFKNDAEFPVRFGSIAGGSALKFGLFRRRETGQWITGSPQKQQILSVTEAIQLARRNRQQLLEAVKLLEALPSNANDADYARLQADLDRLAPDVSDTAWGHKYFSLLFPDKLDDYHNPDYQRFHLIKLLQTPPVGEGRYLVAGRYVAISQELGMPINHLAILLNRLHGGRPYRYWRIGVRMGPANTNYWDTFRDQSFVALGWGDVGELSWVRYNQEDKDKLRTLVAERYYPNTPQVAGQATQKIFNFVATIQPGDLVLAADGVDILGIGRVVGGYNHDPLTDLSHHRPVEWLSPETWKLPETEGLQSAVSELRKTANLLDIERRLQLAPPPPLIPLPAPGIVRLSGIVARIQDVLERKHQVILYGPPGTGKTYWALQTAHQLGAAEFGQPFENLSPSQQAEIIGSAETPGRVRSCTFHPSYGYEDFLEGYRPVILHDQPAFRLVDGIFKRLCQDAARQPGRKFYLIVDEINRGDIPRIFGELITLLEKDKRGQFVLLPVSGQPFQVPANVYIVGTMNTADRSIALLDTALRRRFGFIELLPDPALLNVILAGPLPLGAWLAALNRRIVENIGRDARNLQIGHAFFMENGRPVSDFGHFVRILQEDILPLLEEYCYEDYDALEKILGALVDRPKQRFRIELFDPARQDELLQALLAPSPEIVTDGNTPSPTDVSGETDNDAS